MGTARWFPRTDPGRTRARRTRARQHDRRRTPSASMVARDGSRRRVDRIGLTPAPAWFDAASAGDDRPSALDRAATLGIEIWRGYEPSTACAVRSRTRCMTDEVVDLSAVLGPVRDQGNRGTCLAFATTAGHESTRLSDLGDPRTDLSEELLYWACKQLEGNTSSGTKPAAAARALAETGQP